MASKPQRRCNPLETSRWSDNGIVGDCIITCIVQEMSPLVNIAGPGFDDFVPLAPAPDAGHTSGSQDPHYFVPGDITGILYDNQVD